MSGKKGILSGLVKDAISSLDNSGDSQKPVNLTTSTEKLNSERFANANKSSSFCTLDEGKSCSFEKSERDDGPREPKNSSEGFGSEDFVKWFSEMNNSDVPIAGGKGASLSEMYNHKFPVPPGFVVTAQSFGYYIQESGIGEQIKEILESVNLEETANLQQASKKIREIIEEREMPKEIESEILESYHLLSSEDIRGRVSQDALNILRYSHEPVFVSVRSSATTEDLAEASFAGQQESFLNVKGDRKLIENIKKCFSSLYTPRAIYYRGRKGFKEGEALLAVVVQKMVDSKKSGVVFSRNPIDLSEDIPIEAVYGLGEGIVSGRIKPDHYVVSRDLKVKEVTVADKKIAIVRNSSGENEVIKLNPEISNRQVLNNGELAQIADYAVRLEEHYKKPQDIEFAIDDKIYIVQSRPVTTGKKDREKVELSGNILLEGMGSSPGIGVGIVKIIHDMEDLSKIKKGDILVTEMTNPDMVVAMQKSAAIVTDEGGMTAHASIVSREMGIPCIVGTGEATHILKDGMKITVDGTNGKVYEGEVAKAQSAEIKKVIPTSRVKIKVIVDLPEFAERASQSGIREIGLTRIEGMIATMKKHPLQYEKDNKLEDYTELLRKGIAGILEHFDSMWIRASDIRTDEYGSLDGAPEREINPMLGLHGIRFSLKHPKILEAELLAIKKVAEKNPDKKIGVMFPQVISIEEVKKAKEYYNNYKTENMEFGVMVETPAAVQIIEDICPEVDFISFGTNDLTQFTLGVDRGEESVQDLYNEMHPAIFSQIKRVIGACKRNRVLTSICGQAGSNKEMAEFLFKKGIDSISVNADAAYEISSVIKTLEDEWEKGGQKPGSDSSGNDLGNINSGERNSGNSNRGGHNSGDRRSGDSRNQGHDNRFNNQNRANNQGRFNNQDRPNNQNKFNSQNRENNQNRDNRNQSWNKKGSLNPQILERAPEEETFKEEESCEDENNFLEKGRIKIPAEYETGSERDGIQEVAREELSSEGDSEKDSGSEGFEDIGVYKPEFPEKKARYSYNF